MKTRRDTGTGKPINMPIALLLLTVDRTIHGMVYNAMHLFMEVNPQLFDDCSHEYTEQQNNLESEKANRKAKWDRLTALADSMKQNGHAAAPAVRAPGTAAATGGRTQTRDLDGDDSQQRMERLRLGDERERRTGNSVR